MKKAAENPDQLMLPSFVPVVTTTGPGTFKVDFGKPIFWLSTAQFSSQLGVHPNTVYRWIAEGFLPREVDKREMYRERGMRRYEFSSELLPIVRAKLKAMRG